MYFDSLHDVLVMDGHGVFVWSAYAVTTLVIVVILAAPAMRRRRLMRQIAGDIRRGSLQKTGGETVG